MTTRDTARSTIESVRESLISLSHFVHEHPETNYEEFLTSAAVADAVERAGFQVERNAGGLPTAFKATKGTGSLHVVFCAEYDALPISFKASRAFVPSQGAAEACASLPV